MNQNTCFGMTLITTTDVNTTCHNRTINIKWYEKGDEEPVRKEEHQGRGRN